MGDISDDVDDKLHAFDLLFNEILDHHAPIWDQLKFVENQIPA